MIYIIITTIILIAIVYVYSRVSYINIQRYNKILKIKEHELITHIEDYNRFVNSFDNFYKNKTYQVGLAFLQLKRYQTELLEALDPELDLPMINNLSQSNLDIENLLREMSFLSKHTLKVRDSKKGSIVDKVYFDPSKFSKN